MEPLSSDLCHPKSGFYPMKKNSLLPFSGAGYLGRNQFYPLLSVAFFLSTCFGCSADFTAQDDGGTGDLDSEPFVWIPDTAGDDTATLEDPRDTADSEETFDSDEDSDTEVYQDTATTASTESEVETESVEVPDECPSDPDKTSPGNCGCGTPEGQCARFCEEAEEKDLVVLECGAGTIDSIDFASFGQYSGSCAGGNASIGKCHFKGTTSVIESACLGQSSCQLIADKKEVFDDSCKKEDHFLVVEYTCRYSQGCPDGALKLSPGKCGCNAPDVDRDGDGSADCNDECDDDPFDITQGICGCGEEEIDEDGDGVPSCNDECDKDPDKTEKGLCGCGKPDIDVDDRDGDGTIDCQDKCPDDPAKTAPGICGCHQVDNPSDRDGDGTADCADECQTDPHKANAGYCGCGKSESSCGFCLDTPDYRDPQGYKCKDWNGYDCHSVEQFGYTKSQGFEIRYYCAKSCNLC